MNKQQKTSLSRREFLHTAFVTGLGALAAACSPGDEQVEDTDRPQLTDKPIEIKPTVTSTAVVSGTKYFTPHEAANQPVGVGRGIHPGRVVWAHNPTATNWDGNTGYWWQPENLSYAAVHESLVQSLTALTGQAEPIAAWQALFYHFNQQRGITKGYQPGEKIAIKLNLNAVTDYAYADNYTFSSPQLARAVVEQLIKAGVPVVDITLYDAIRLIPDLIYEQFKESQFNGLHFVDFNGTNGREPVRRDEHNKLHWSVEVGRNPTYLPTCVTEARYLINLATLKGHSLAGVTLTAKNHFGTISADLNGKPSKNAPQGANIHGYIAAHDFNAGPGWQWRQCKMGTYNALVDLMAHPHLGEKTLLFVVEGFYVVHDQSSPMTSENRFLSAPFNNNWPASLFVSQDGVAIDSVGLDFLRNEPTMQRPDVLPEGSTCENYLHEAADIGQAPSSTQYNPTFDESYVTPASLGVHEHWNNPEAKEYSRNRGANEGIELVKVI